MVAIPNAGRIGDMPTSSPFPEGIYHLRCDKADFGKSAKGQNKVDAQFTVFGPVEADEHHGRKVFETFMLEGEGRFRLRQFLEVTGEDEDFRLEDTDQLLKREAGAVITIEPARKDPATGKSYDARNRIGRFLPIE